MLRRTLFALALLSTPAPSAHALSIGTLDPGFGTVLPLGHARRGFDLGGSNNDVLRTMRALADGRIVAAGVIDTTTAGVYQLGITVTLPNGSPDPAVGGGTGQISRTTFGQNFDPFRSAFAIDADGSIVVIIGNSDGRLRIGRYDRFGTQVGGTTLVGNAGTFYAADHALVDANGRIVVSGNQRPVGQPQSSANAFVLRTDASGLLDPVFGIRDITFSANSRDDGYRIREVGDGRLAVCSRVGDLAGSALRPGVAVLNADGSPDTNFDGDGLRTDSIVVDGVVADAPCNDIGVVQAGGVTRFLITGRAAQGATTAVFVAAYQNDGSRQTTYGSGGQKLLGGDAVPFTITGFPVLMIGRDSDDIGRAYVVSDANTAAGMGFLQVTRLTSLGSPDTSFGTSGMTIIGYSFPSIGGFRRTIFPLTTAWSDRGLLVGSVVQVDDPDFLITRFALNRVFASGFE
jgi:uncharacterized delta-60 repeat protein